MSLEDFQLMDNEASDSSLLKRDFLKVYHQQAANFNDSDQNIEFIFGENINSYQIGKAYLQFEMTIEKSCCCSYQSSCKWRCYYIGKKRFCILL